MKRLSFCKLTHNLSGNTQEGRKKGKENSLGFRQLLIKTKYVNLFSKFIVNFVKKLRLSADAMSLSFQETNRLQFS